MRAPIACVCALLALGAIAPAFGGDLAPPPGPVAPSMKPLDVVEPRIEVNALPGDATALHVISAPGSYFLSAPIAGVAGKSGVRIDAPSVTLDLRGFELVGVPGSLDGVNATSKEGGVVVRNGGARAWGAMGLNLLVAHGCSVSGVRAVGNASAGISVGSGSRVEDCVAAGNAGGILGGVSCVFTRCVADANTENGFYALEGSVWAECASTGNGSSGYYLDGEGCLISRCSGHGNGLHGIATIYAATIDACTATRNGRSGAFTNSGGLVRGCTFAFNTEHGLFAPVSTTAEACRLEGNGLTGVFSTNDATIRGCAVVNNLGDGVSVGSRCVVEDTLCSGNGAPSQGAGILVVGEGCRIEHNTLADNARGVVVTGAGNLITRNDARGNPPGGIPGAANFVLAPGNSYGPIIVVGAGDLSAAPASAHPLANLSR